MSVRQGEVTELLQEFKQDRDILERLARLVYDDIHRIARARRSEWPAMLTLQTTAVVHEAFAKLFDGDPRIKDRRHLMNLMSRVIRQIIVDHARRQMRQKRGRDPVRTDLEVENLLSDTDNLARVLELEAALERLDDISPELVDLVCAHWFAGHSAEELARVNGVSRRTINRQLKRANVWLRFELEP